MNKIGKFFVIEGTDGSGKSEQFKLLKERIEKEGYGVHTFDFPQYEKESSFFVRQYLNGAYGGWRDVGPYKASVFYALDRFDISPKICEARDSGKIVLSNRYVASNLGHQGAKLDGLEREKFFRWNNDFEFLTLGIPRPDLNIILHVSADIAFKLIEGKPMRRYIYDKKRDMHEEDIEHLRAAEKTYLDIARTWPDEYTIVECTENDRLLSIAEIHERVWNVAKKFL